MADSADDTAGSAPGEAAGEPPGPFPGGNAGAGERAGAAPESRAESAEEAGGDSVGNGLPAGWVPGGEDRSDRGCLVLLGFAFAAVFFAPVVMLLGGAPVIVPLLVLFLLAILTPMVNPAEGKSGKAKWIGRMVTFAVLAAAMAALAWVFFGGLMEPGILRE